MVIIPRQKISECCTSHLFGSAFYYRVGEATVELGDPVSTSFELPFDIQLKVMGHAPPHRGIACATICYRQRQTKFPRRFRDSATF
jgi:hypothetical protein